VQSGAAAGLASGFSHPLSGWDHTLAMVAVGVWGAQLGAPAMWLLPVAFPMMMAGGAFLGLVGAPLPGVEIAIAASALLLGLMVTFERRYPVGAAMVIVGFFAIFHGHAHGSEMPMDASGVEYGLGFMLATGLLHLAGIGIGFLIGMTTKWLGDNVYRVAGGVASIAGVAILIGVL
jgi:urease accessory protein